MRVRRIDHARLLSPYAERLMSAFGKFLEDGQLTLGPYVAEFEAWCSSYLGARHTIAVSSGTDALLCALMALKIGPGDLVITTPYTYVATASTIVRTGARPIFVDADSATGNIDPERVAECLEELSEGERKRVKAIIPVHLFGLGCPMGRLCEIADSYGISIIEDTAQAFGCRMEFRGQKRAAGTLGKIGCYSFFPNKNLAALGDGGLVTCEDDELAQRIREIRFNGTRDGQTFAIIGGNFRMDALHACLLRIKAEELENELAVRKRQAQLYRAKLASLPGITTPSKKLELPEHGGHTYNQFVIQVEEGQRDRVREHLKEAGIETMVHYSIPLHLQKAFEACGYTAGSLPVIEKFCKRIITLPLGLHLSDDDVEFVSQQIAAF